MITKEKIEEKIWDYFDKYNMATREDEGGVPCADEIAQYMYDTIKNFKSEAIKEFAERVKKAMRTGALMRDKENCSIIDNLVKEMMKEQQQ